MRDAAKEEGFECNINAYSLEEMNNYGPDADVILLGPQVRYNLKKVSDAFPDKPVAVIDMTLYGMMKGKEVLDNAKKLMGC
ncbi:MAG: PTS sugar transporter subunit IIB [Lachnospiraceae bacterium]|nr:PTS sugar transporter subunit IIB [Lachnospiraceae bacterium]